MRNLLLFNRDGQGRWRVFQAPSVGSTVIFSQRFLNSYEEEGVVIPPHYQRILPAGMVTFPNLLVDSVITVDPQQGQTMTFRIFDIDRYEDANGDVPDPNILVWYTTRLT